MKSEVISVIMGGGRGTRLAPLTQARSKPAVPLAGKYRLVDIPISNCLNSGYNRIYLLTQFQTASLHRHIQESYKFDPFGGGFVDILAAEQTDKGEHWYQGTADAVRQNLHHFRGGENDLFLILSGDQLYRMDFSAMVEQHRRSGNDVTIAAKPIPVSQVEGLGLMRVSEDLQIREFAEKPKDPKVIDSLAMAEGLMHHVRNPKGQKHCLASMGIYVFNKHTLYHALLSQPNKTDFGKEIIPTLLTSGKMGAFVFDDYWEDIGTVRNFFEANLLLTDPNPPFDFYRSDNVVYTHARFLPPSKVMDCKVGKAIMADGCICLSSTFVRSVVGVRAVVREGTQFEHVVMMGADYFESAEDLRRNITNAVPDIGVGRNCVIRNAIIDKNARIGHNCVLDPAGKPDLWQKGDIIVRDGVLIVAKNGVVPNGTVV